MKLLTGVLQSALAAGVACALVLAGTTRAAAQTAEDQRTAAAGQSQGPLVLTPISQAFVLAPDVKITKVNGQTSTLVGLYGGRSFEGRVFVGGGGYWLADPRQDARMFYAGLVVGGRIIGSDRLNVNAKALLGAGDATVFTTVSAEPFHRPDRTIALPPETFRVGSYDSFLVLEPEVDLQLGLTNGIRVSVGGGYRATNADRGFSPLLRGATGSVSVQFDLGR